MQVRRCNQLGNAWMCSRLQSFLIWDIAINRLKVDTQNCRSQRPTQLAKIATGLVSFSFPLVSNCCSVNRASSNTQVKVKPLRGGRVLLLWKSKRKLLHRNLSEERCWGQLNLCQFATVLVGGSCPSSYADHGLHTVLIPWQLKGVFSREFSCNYVPIATQQTMSLS